MEYALPELLTRQDLIRILQLERQLRIPNIENLSDNELVRIYKTFAIPLAKRERTRCRIRKSDTNETETMVEMDVDEAIEYNLPVTITYLDIAMKKCLDYTKKREFESCCDDESLSSATKRIKISRT